MTERNFTLWLSKFKNSIADYSYYVDFEKVYKNVDAVKVELNILNSLIGDKNIEEDFEKLVRLYPRTLECIPILIAVRKKEIAALSGTKEVNYAFNKMNCPVEQYKIFMRETGLFDLMQNHIVSNLVDYVTGIETGLDSNGRKNRGGHLMEDLVERHIKNAGFIKNMNYFKEMNLSDVQKKWGIDLSKLSNTGKTQKRFDFVVKTDTMIYGIETNFYASNGSKLNETLALEAEGIDGFTFVWFTDGKGWMGAKNNLEETFDVLPYIYNINDMNNGVMGKLFV